MQKQSADKRRSDPAVKQILLVMNEKDNFIIEDLDDHHLVIKADEEFRVRKELELEVRANELRRDAPSSCPSWRRTLIPWKRNTDTLSTLHLALERFVKHVYFRRYMEV